MGCRCHTTERLTDRNQITSKHPKYGGLCSSAPNAFVSSDVWPPRHAINGFVEMISHPGALGQLAHFFVNNV